MLATGAVCATAVSVLLAAFWPESTDPEVQGLALGGAPIWIPVSLCYSLFFWVVQDGVKVSWQLHGTVPLVTCSCSSVKSESRMCPGTDVQGSRNRGPEFRSANETGKCQAPTSAPPETSTCSYPNGLVPGTRVSLAPTSGY